MPNINLKAPNPVRVQEGLQELERALTSELAAHVKLPVATVAAVLAELYRHRKVHICGWSRNKQGSPIKIHAWGDGEDVAQPIKTYKLKKDLVVEAQLPFPRCDIAASWIRSAV